MTGIKLLFHAYVTTRGALQAGSPLGASHEMANPPRLGRTRRNPPPSHLVWWSEMALYWIPSVCSVHTVSLLESFPSTCAARVSDPGLCPESLAQNAKLSASGYEASWRVFDPDTGIVSLVVFPTYV
jgi:hypothetical protein